MQQHIARLHHRYEGLIAGVIAISFSPLAVKMVAFTPTASAFYRSFYAALFFLAIAWWRGQRMPAGWGRWLPLSLLAGVFLGIDLIFWHKTIIYLGAGPATFLGNSQILFVTLFAAVVFREKIPAVFYVAMAVSLVGLYLLLPERIVDVSRSLGYAMGLVVGMTYAGMLIALRYAKMRSRGPYPEVLSLGACFFSSAIVIALYAVVAERGSLMCFDMPSHLVIAVTAFICQTVGWYLINSTITRIPAHQGSLMLMVQPVLATIWGAVFFHEPLLSLQVAGIVLSLGGVTFYHLRRAASRPYVLHDIERV